MLFCASSHTHHLVPQGHLQCSRLLICKPGSVKEVVGDAQLYHVALVGGETHCWWGNREWVVVSPPEKLPLGGKHRAGLGVLGLQVGRAQPGTVGVTGGHFLASWDTRRSHSPTPPPTAPFPPSCQSVQQPSKEQWPPGCFLCPINRFRKAEVCIFGKRHMLPRGHLSLMSLRSDLTTCDENRLLIRKKNNV